VSGRGTFRSVHVGLHLRPPRPMPRAASRFAQQVVGAFAIACVAACDGAAPVSPPVEEPRTLAVGDPTAGSWDSLPYVSFRHDLTGVVRVLFRWKNGTPMWTCNGVLLEYAQQRTVLTAASCVDFAVRRIGGVGSITVTGYEAPSLVVNRRARKYVFHPSFDPARYGAHNVALLYLDQPFPASVQHYVLSDTPELLAEPLTVASYGVTGNTTSGTVFGADTMLSPLPILRHGTQMLETACDELVWVCGRPHEPVDVRGSHGPILLADLDRPGVSATQNTLCHWLRFCNAGLSTEAMPSHLYGEGAPALYKRYVIGIYNKEHPPYNAPVGAMPGQFGSWHSFVCVSDWRANHECTDNAQWIITNAL
jgi:hypothetical protein